MSWSVNFIGRPDKIIEAIEAESIKLGGQSKNEFDGAKPGLITLVNQNFEKDGIPVTLHLNANGSGYSVGGEMKRQCCNVELKTLSGKLV